MRILHTMLRVGDLDKSIDFYVNRLGMNLLRKKVCSRQKEAARLGLLANKSLIKAFEIEGANPPMQAIKASQQRWESILNDCWRKSVNL